MNYIKSLYSTLLLDEHYLKIQILTNTFIQNLS